MKTKILAFVIAAVASANVVAAPKDGPFAKWLEKSKGVFKDAPNEMDRRLIELNLPTATKTPARQRRVLVFYRCGGFIHRSIPFGNHAMKAIAKKTGAFAVDLADDYAVFTPGNLAKYDAIIFNNTTNLDPSEEQRKAILDFIKGGKGVAGFHAASDNFKNWEAGAAMIGGIFNGHPWGGGGTWAFKVEETDHPLNAAFKGNGFWHKDEIYWYRPQSFQGRENLRVLVSLDMTRKESQAPLKNKNDQPEQVDVAVSWCRKLGKGRLFYTNLGHNHTTFQNRTILQHMLDGIQYALGDLKADASPTAQLAKPPTIALAPDPPIDATKGPDTRKALLKLFPSALKNREQWKLTASHKPETTKFAVDGDAKTRYSTGTAMKPDMWVQVELPKVTKVSGLILDTRRSRGDFAQMYGIRLSIDGESWSKPIVGQGCTFDIIKFKPQQARFIKLTQLGTHRLFWSIHELDILGAK
ncbi:MAG: ThuA domain-containing protein [Limisphaerales bacterium]